MVFWTKLHEKVDEMTSAKPANSAVVLLCSIIVFFGFILEPSLDGVYLFGIRIPDICMSKVWFDLDCIGCGLTRSVCYTAHGDFAQAWKLHILGIPIFFVSLFGLLQQCARYWRSRK